MASIPVSNIIFTFHQLSSFSPLFLPLQLLFVSGVVGSKSLWSRLTGSSYIRYRPAVALASILTLVILTTSTWPPFTEYQLRAIHDRQRLVYIQIAPPGGWSAYQARRRSQRAFDECSRRTVTIITIIIIIIAIRQPLIVHTLHSSITRVHQWRHAVVGDHVIENTPLPNYMPRSRPR